MPQLDFAIAVLAWTLVVGIAWGWLNKRRIPPSRARMPVVQEFDPQTLKATRLWERRLTQLREQGAVIDTTYAQVRIVPRKKS